MSARRKVAGPIFEDASRPDAVKEKNLGTGMALSFRALLSWRVQGNHRIRYEI